MSFGLKVKGFFGEIWNFLKSKLFLINFGIALVLAFLIIWGTFLGLESYTQHDEYFEVPDFTGLSRKEANEMAKAAFLRNTIIDSVYQFNFADGRLAKAGCIVEQIPGAGAKVKQNRRIFLTVKTIQSEMVKVPHVLDISLLQAQAELENQGLVVGQVNYVISDYKNLVLNQRYKNRDSIAGIKLPKGSIIDLTVGTTEEEKTYIPNFINETYRDAKDKTIRLALNIGKMHFDNTVKTFKDSLNSRVHQQEPHHSSKVPVSLGSTVELWFTLTDSKVKMGLSTEINEAENQTQQYLDSTETE